MKLIVITALAVSAAALLLGRFMIVPWLRRRRHQQSFQYCQSVPIPPMPEILDKDYSLPSKRRKLFKYRINLYHLTCSCRGFKSYRGFFPVNDLRRLCRHLRGELATVNAIGLFDEYLQRIISDRIRDKCYERLVVGGNDVIAGFSPNRSVVRIFTRCREQGDPVQGPFTGHVTKYILNVQEEAWIYGDTPPNENAIIDATKEILRRFKDGTAVMPPQRPTLPTHVNDKS